MLEVSDRLENVFFRYVPLPGGPVPARRPPGEAGAALSELIAQAPNDAELYALRAHQQEQQLDFAAAEADWKQHAALSADRAAGQLALADFYHRRLQPRKEVLALVASQAFSPNPERFVSDTEQRAWRTFERIFKVIEAHALPAAMSWTIYRVWLARYPNHPEVYKKFFSFLLGQERYGDAEQLIASYQRTFPKDAVFPVQARASMERQRSSVEQALAVYDRAFEPLWPPALVQNYFKLLGETRRKRDFLDHARASVAADPDDLNAACRIFYYYQQQGNLVAAQQALLKFRQDKESGQATWTVDELITLARLSEAVHNYNEAARFYYALYSLSGAHGEGAETGLAGLVHVLLTAPEGPIRFGAADLSFYRDVATLDPYPGFLNGILSLLFNSVNPAQHYATQNRSSLAYFHRARAAELLALLDSRFPASRERPKLSAKLLEAYATYGDNAGVIRSGRKFLATFPRAQQRTRVALLMAEAFARTDRVKEEFATYDRLLEELAARADGMPLGAGIVQGRAGRAGRAAGRARSPDYARVLDRYIARLVSKKRLFDALALYRQQLNRHPDDPGLYQRLAAFLEQNHLGAELEQIYRRALARFDDRSWYHRLARWYLREKRETEFERLTGEVVRIFSGGELEEYFRQVVRRRSLDPQLYLQVNLYAHDRFPHNLTFVRNLLRAYRRRETRNPAAREQLLRRHWFYAEDLRSQFFQFLSRRARLQSELDAVRASHPAVAAQRWPELVKANPAAAQFIAEGELWLSHLESAAPVVRALAAGYPTEVDLGQRAAVVHRSLAPFEPRHAEAAVEIEENLHQFQPRERAPLTRIGEIYADREQFDRARPYWDRIVRIEAGKPEGYLEAATVFWDYFLFDDALRLFSEGRDQLANPSLFAYEAGAIYENKRDYSRAVEEYVKGTLAAPGNSTARRRLLRLALRPELRSTVETATAELVSGQNPAVTAVSLRVAVLDAQKRRAELEKFLLRLVAEATAWELLKEIDGHAKRLGLETVQEKSLQRQIAITGDPVDRLRLSLALASFYESHQNIEEARQVLESLYDENPTILGVVRANVGFFWRQEMKERAVAVLLKAASASYPGLRKQFTFEAARKSTEMGAYDRARQLMASLLAEEPFHGDYLATVADTYAREGDDAGLRDFYVATIKVLGEAPLSRDQQTERIAALRRGLIPALTRLGETAAAVDQYIEIINRYPEDEGLLKEAAFYAQRHNLQQRLILYYKQTAAKSPRDYRWPMVLAHLETHFEHFPAAVAAYTRATQIRPDRTDLRIARASLEERLSQFDDAVRSYQEIYELAYQDRRWMEKVAELRARQGEVEAAVDALRKTYLEGRPEQPKNFFAMARKLESWGLLPPARQAAERGVELAGEELLRNAGYAVGARDYARILTRMRRYKPAYARLQSARNARPTGRTRSRFQSTLREMGAAVDRYFAPEEKATFAAFLETQKRGMELETFAQNLLPLAKQAGLAALEAQWRYELMMAWPGQRKARPHQRRLQVLQQRRMKFAELGSQLEAYWNIYPQKPDKRHLLAQAATAHRAAGNTEAELRLLDSLQEQAGLSGQLLDRYFEILLAHDPDRLVSLASSGRARSTRDAAANFALTGGDAELAQAAIAARGKPLPSVWTSAYSALVGLYFASRPPLVDTSFRTALGTGPIGERVGSAVDRKLQLAGDIWFYYGSRYGEYLDLIEQGNPDDYLPAELEHTPGRAAAYFALGDYFRDTGELGRARAEYDHALELDPNRGDAHDRVAVILWEQGKHQEARARWQAALQAYSRVQDAGRVPETFWANIRGILENIGRHQLLPALRDEADQLLRTYVRRNGSYRVQPLLQGVLAASSTSSAGVEWIADLAGVAGDPVGFLGELLKADWLPADHREPVFLRILKTLEERIAQTHGTARSYAAQTLRNWQLRWITYVMDTMQTERAQAELAALPESTRRLLAGQVAPLEIRLAARAKTLDALLERYRREPEKAASAKALRKAATALRSEGDDHSARLCLEFLYTRALEQRELSAANFLGLAEVRLETGDLTGAMGLLRRMTLVSGKAYEAMKPAAVLLQKRGHLAEAAEFRALLLRVMPWDAEVRLRLAEALLAVQQDRQRAVRLLTAVVNEPGAVYETRVAAALLLRSAGGEAFRASGAELDLLARGGPLEARTFEQLFFYHGRLQAATATADPGVSLRLLRGALEIKPDAEAPRLPLLRAALKAKRYQLAVSGLQPLLQAGRIHRFLQRWEARNEENQTAFSMIGPTARRFLSRSGFSPEERAAAARVLAEAFERLHRRGAAEMLLRIAIHLEPSAAMRAQLERRVKVMAAERHQRVQNSLRRPKVSKNLEQSRPVRPQLTATPKRRGGGLP